MHSGDFDIASSKADLADNRNMTSDGLIAVVLAPFFGSFLGLVADRLPLGLPVLFGRSTCDHCGRRLSPLELVPLFSYLL